MGLMIKSIQGKRKRVR